MQETASTSIGPTRLYGSLIALASGAYAIYRSLGMMEMTPSAWFMLALGLVVIAHGLALTTPLADRLGGASGPLMIVWALLMLGHQAWLGMGASMDASPMGMTWDLGMVALALLMLASGIVMTWLGDEQGM